MNQLAENLTTQVRAISEVASAVTKGDLTQMIRVEAKGEVEELKDTINQMIANLKETTLRNQEQDWLKSNLAKFTQMLQGQKDLNTVTRRILSELGAGGKCTARYVLHFEQDENCRKSKIEIICAYALQRRIEYQQENLRLGEGLVGQVRVGKRKNPVNQCSEGLYQRSVPVLGEASPVNVIVLPVLFEKEIKAVIELASFR